MRALEPFPLRPAMSTASLIPIPLRRLPQDKGRAANGKWRGLAVRTELQKRDNAQPRAITIEP